MKTSVRSFLQLLPVGISLLLIGAHFLRSNDLLLVGLSLMCIGLLFVKKPLIARLIQVVLVLATIEWIYTTYVFASIRIESGLPYIRLVIILGMVACLTLGSAGVFFLKTQKDRYRL